MWFCYWLLRPENTQQCEVTVRRNPGLMLGSKNQQRAIISRREDGNLHPLYENPPIMSVQKHRTMTARSVETSLALPTFTAE